MIDLAGFSSLQTLVTKQLALWPEHAKYLDGSFSSRPPGVFDISEKIAALVLKLAETSGRGLEEYCEDYRYLCKQIVLPEEMHFRRYGRYRLDSFSQAYQEVYSNAEVMGRYMTGLLVSNVLWDPHARAMAHFVNQYLPSLPPGADHLEIGPGHGLLLYFATQQPDLGTIAGWDISPTSIAQTKEALEVMAPGRQVTLQLQDLFRPEFTAVFDSVTLSEILEHLEDPKAALHAVGEVLRPGGRLWVNVPVNSPAPDHLYLLRTPEEACELVEAGGFDITDRAFFPASGLSLEDARRRTASITCVIAAQRR